MRALIAAACIAVIAFVGYFFWGEWSREQARQTAAKATVERLAADARARDSLFRRAEAEPDDEMRVAEYCRRVQVVAGNLEDNTLANNIAHNCRYFGYLD